MSAQLAARRDVASGGQSSALGGVVGMPNDEPSPTISFMLAGRQLTLSADDVRTSLAGHHPESIRQYWAEIDHVRWPVKQVIALATGIPRTDFQSQNGRRLLARLGFPIGQGNALIPPVAKPSARASHPTQGPVRRWPHLPADVVLVGCVKSKLDRGARAKDLYISVYFAKMRAYAEASGLPWFILSAEHGLVSPETWLEPYDRYLPEATRDYRRAWGQRVASQLEQAIGPLNGTVVDIHAGAAYVEAVGEALRPLGVVLIDQLKGLSFGRRLSWYVQQADRVLGRKDVLSQLSDPARPVRLSDLVASGGWDLRAPGMYSWWVDEAGAADLTRGLGHRIERGLVYAGLAGATRSGGSSSANTLWGRIATMHLGKRRELSTLRRSLGSILASADGLPAIDEAQLTLWMYAHLRVTAIPVGDADTLGDLETETLTTLDPPLNLAKVGRTPLRERLSALRKQYAAVVEPNREGMNERG